MNRYKETAHEQPEVKTKKGNPSKVARTFVDVLNGNVLTREYVVSNLPYICFLTLIMLVYIGMGYYAEKNAKKILRIEAELNLLKDEYVTTKTELNMISRQSQIADSTAAMGLFESRDYPPRIISVKKDVMKKIY